jgi:hypothetical protein
VKENIMNTAQSIIRGLTLLAIAAGALLAAGRASAQPPPDYGHDFVTVGAPGNRGANVNEVPWYPDRTGAGRVDYEYRITRTEVTIGQWWEFAQIYQQYVAPDDNVTFGALSGDWLLPAPGRRYTLDPGAVNFPVTTSWHLAARYCNWLENGRGTDQASFETGVYDTSTFTQNPDGTRNDQIARNPGSRYFIPTHDEQLKAAYYDPNRYGDGQDGYWLFPNRSNTPPVLGPPSAGGQTNVWAWYTRAPLDAGSYPDMQSPWGLLDCSGGETEWSETVAGNVVRSRYRHGSSLYNGFPEYETYDRFDFARSAFPDERSGFRIASVIPSSGAGCLSVLTLLFMSARRRTR